MSSQISETELYAPIKAFLEAQGYEVKAEVGPADVVALRDGGPPVIVELKTGFSLALFHQGIARLSVCDDVYLAVPRGTGRRFQRALAENTRLARRLGMGLITVRLETGLVEVHCDPGPYAPRKSVRRSTALLSEFARRRGDPNTGGMRGAASRPTGRTRWPVPRIWPRSARRRARQCATPPGSRAPRRSCGTITTAGSGRWKRASTI
jgi:hypothetical protein